jgi:hypothetical protein
MMRDAEYNGIRGGHIILIFGFAISGFFAVFHAARETPDESRAEQRRNFMAECLTHLDIATCRANADELYPIGKVAP